MFTKKLLFLLLLCSSIAQAQFWETCTQWFKNADFSSMVTPFALVGSFAGIGYLAYRDYQHSKKINALTTKINELESEKSKFHSTVDPEAHCNLFNRKIIKKALKNYENQGFIYHTLHKELFRNIPKNASQQEQFALFVCKLVQHIERRDN